MITDQDREDALDEIRKAHEALTAFNDRTVSPSSEVEQALASLLKAGQLLGMREK